MKKTIVISIVALVVLLVAGLGFWKWKSMKNAQVSVENQGQENEQKGVGISTGDWKIYKNEKLNLSVKYPNTFSLDDKVRTDGHIASFMEFNKNAKDLSGKLTPGYFATISIYHWENINDDNLKGGTWEGEKKYTGLQDFLADSKHTSISTIGETNIDGIKAYMLSMPGEIGYEAIMFGHNGGYYRISFPWTQKKLDENIKQQFITSIRFER